MAKVTLGGFVIEGSIEELKQMGVKIPFDEVEPESLKAGDYAKVAMNEGLLNIGDIVKISEIVPSNYDFYVTRVYDGREEAFNYSEIVRATDEEVAEAKRKLAEKEIEAKWTKIGRKPYEFKKGDIVRRGNALYEVNEFQPLKRKTTGKEFINHEKGITLGKSEYWVNFEDVELITPVEARVDL